MFNSPLVRLFRQAPLKPIFLFSLLINALLLVPSWYMLEVYDRVVMSRNVHTLLMLGTLVLLLLFVMEYLSNIRQSLMSKAGEKFVLENQEKVFDVSFYRGVKTNQPFNFQSVDHLQKIQAFFQSSILLALLDLPFSLIFLVFIYVISPILGHLAILIALVIALLTVLNEKATHADLTRANQTAAQSQVVLNNIVRNAEVIRAMQMESALEHRWLSKHFDYVGYQSRASESATVYQSMSRLMQQILGSTMLGMGCLLLLNGDLPIGGSGLIISSILATRFVTPLVQLISGWKVLINAADAYLQLSKLEQDYSQRKSKIKLPDPIGNVLVENVSLRIPQTELYVLKNIYLSLKSGQSIALIGPSGSGKTTLGRLLVGGLSPDMGSVRLDGVPLFEWDKAAVGPFIGYLPQEVELQEGTIAQNVSRFSLAEEESKVTQALELAGLTSFISALPEGVHTRIGAGGMTLPGGKRQLIGLARAVYDLPKLIVLDEPSANLDKLGEVALKQLLASLRQAGSTVVLITHHKSYLDQVDWIMLLMNGEAKLVGPKDEVMQKLAPAAAVTQSANRKLK